MTTTATRADVAVLEGVSRTYGEGPTAVRALENVDLTIRAGELVVVLGPSGSGKTTLLNLVGGIERPTTGRIAVGGRDITNLGVDALTDVRRDTVGFVFQFFNLIPTLTARENVALIAELTGAPIGDRVDDVLAAVGLADRGDHFPGQLSGGEQQRVAIARALAKQPPLLLCDEPTGALDVETGRAILGILQQLVRDRGETVVIVTHNAAIAALADRVLRLRSGAIVEDVANDAPADAADVAW